MFFFKDIKKLWATVNKSEFFSEDTQRFYWLTIEGCADFLEDYKNLKERDFPTKNHNSFLSSLQSNNHPAIVSGDIKMFIRKPEIKEYIQIDKEVRNGFLYADKGAFIQNGNETEDDSLYSRKYQLFFKNPQYLNIVV